MYAENVGNVLRGLVFDYLIKNGCTTYDFLAGSSRNKRTWSTHMAMDLQIEWIKPQFKSYIYFKYPELREHLKNAIIKFLPKSIKDSRRKN